MRSTFPRLAIGTGLLAGAIVAFTFGGIALLAWNASVQAAASGAEQAAISLRWIAALLVITIVFFLGFIALLMGHLTPMVTMPILALRESVHRIRQGAVGERFVYKGPEEIQELGAEINALAFSLAERDAKLSRTMKIDAIRSLINGVAHEVNTPLTVIWSNEHMALQRLVELSINRETDTGPAMALLQQNHKSILRLQMLSRALAEVAGRNQGSSGCDINLIMTAIGALTHHGRSPDVRFESRLEAKRRVSVPAEEIFHAVYSLMHNIGSGLAGNETVDVWTQDRDDEVELGIRGSAGGILNELVDLMREPDLMEKGTPAGELRFAHAQIEAAGGSIVYVGEEGKAFQWRILLPAAKQDPEGGETADARSLKLLDQSRQAEPQGGRLNGRTPRISREHPHTKPVKR